MGVFICMNNVFLLLYKHLYPIKGMKHSALAFITVAAAGDNGLPNEKVNKIYI